MPRIRRKQNSVKVNSKLTLDEFRPILCAMAFVVMLIAMYRADQEAAKEPVRLSNVPSYSTEFEDRRYYSIDTLVEVGDRIYILPGASNGFVQVYDLEGNYQFSLFFYDHGKGGFSLGTDGEYLYVRDKRSNIYTFENGEFLKYERREEAEKRPHELWKSTAGYELRDGDLWRVSGGSEVLLIQELVSRRTGEILEILGYFLVTGLLWLIASYLKRRRTSS